MTLIEWFYKNGHADYGAIVKRSDVLDFLGITVPEMGTKKEFDAIALAEVDAMQSVRDTLLREGKYIKQDGEFYRVLLPSQNKEQVEAFMRAADRKLKRAVMLSKTTPAEHMDVHDNAGTRARMKRESIRDARLYGAPTAPGTH